MIHSAWWPCWKRPVYFNPITDQFLFLPGWADAENYHGDDPGHPGHEEEAQAGEASLQTRLPKAFQLITVSGAISCYLYYFMFQAGEFFL